MLLTEIEEVDIPEFDLAEDVLRVALAPVLQRVGQQQEIECVIHLVDEQHVLDVISDKLGWIVLVEVFQVVILALVHLAFADDLLGNSLELVVWRATEIELLEHLEIIENSQTLDLDHILARCRVWPFADGSIGMFVDG